MGIAWARVAVYATVIVPMAMIMLVRFAKVSIPSLAAATLPGAMVALAAAIVDLVALQIAGRIGLHGFAAAAIPAMLAGVAGGATLLAVDKNIRAGVAKFLPQGRQPAIAPSGSGQGEG
jgi:hypothetical protein